MHETHRVRQSVPPTKMGEAQWRVFCLDRMADIAPGESHNGRNGQIG